ncbi:unnamed protein product [Ophioblennius macclurei]
MNHGSNRLHPGESGELANGLTNHEHQRQTHTDGESLLLCAALIKLEDNYRFGPKKIKRWSRSPAYPIKSVHKRVYLSGWQTFSAIHNVNWDPDCSSIPSLASPSLSLLTVPGVPLRILLRSRPLSPKAGPNPLHRSS